ncbi:tyrosine-type recombinase/integrase [Variovorax sp. J22G73]|uniref:tyrosine-type recombinase/integrase n=1 Tax=unclassified Variovorax TaxID=663243 RepID=UPI002577AE2B|nr:MULTISPECIES: tyrosine-type recombinase/integrase [unclassified Variovorax]MDM0007493.1 tyrosine-type recombinase/integrase [Variovorax sp. J22R203]MDM0100147.1 tyrosine-type recombinase/integrase [Variovorax sp. J22G73]
MILLAATCDYKLAGLPRPGFPILLNGDMTSCWEVNEFLRFYLLRGQIGSKRSWEPIARSLYDYFGFLEAHDLAWNDIERGERKNLLAAYRDYSFETAKLARNTIRHRMIYISEFYKFAVRQGWIANLPFGYEERYVGGATAFLGHVAGNGGKAQVNSAMPRRHRSIVKFLSLDQARLLVNSATNVHHAAIIRTGLLTGLRREELATFPCSYVFAPDLSSGGVPNVSVTLDPTDGTGMRTKGQKKRVILMGREVMAGLHKYLSIHRGERASLSTGQPQQLFLNRYGQPYAGDGKGIEAIIRDLGRKVGLHTHPHMLRHTYATHTLHTLQRRSAKDRRIEPLVFLQNQLGHASINTTMVYLHVSHQVADDAALAYDEELNFWAEPA